MDIDISFPGGRRVVAQVGAHRIETDQPVELGGNDAAPAPFDLFLASIATCAGVYALGFLQARALSTEGLRMRQIVETDDTTHLPTRIRLELTLPPDVPEKYRAAVVRAVENCKVKKTMAAMPSFEVVLSDAEQSAQRSA
jgi:ribosomal protein S12 methylthiotransferase accessory factor